MLELRNKMLES